MPLFSRDQVRQLEQIFSSWTEGGWLSYTLVDL